MEYEVPSYEEGVGGDGEQQGFALQNAPFFVSFLSVMKEMKAPCRVKPCIKNIFWMFFLVDWKRNRTFAD